MDHKIIEEILGNLLSNLQLEFDSISIAEKDGITRVNISAPTPSKIIGWHGETLNSIQHILKSMIRSIEKLNRSPFIVVDIDGYRLNQEDRVCKMAEKKADFVRKTANRIALPPMSPYFRRVVHLHVANTEHMNDITTESKGEGDYRQIILRLKDESKAGNESDEGEMTPVIEEEELSPAVDDGLDNLDI